MIARGGIHPEVPAGIHLEIHKIAVLKTDVVAGGAPAFSIQGIFAVHVICEVLVMSPETVLDIGGAGASGHVAGPAVRIILLKRIDQQVHDCDRLPVRSFIIVSSEIKDKTVIAPIGKIEGQFRHRHGNIGHHMAAFDAVACYESAVVADGNVHGPGDVVVVDKLDVINVLGCVHQSYAGKCRYDCAGQTKQEAQKYG